MSARMALNQRLTVIAGAGLEELRAYFVDNEPLGGRLRPEKVIHRGGVDVALDGFGPGGDCSAEAWVNVLRIARTTADAFPGDNPQMSNCGGGRSIAIQFGIARCAVMPDDAGNPPTPAELGREGLVSIDDGARLDNAMCRLVKRLEREEVIDGYAINAGEPVGPMGGIISWVQTAALYVG